jgi:hypothetical protein
MNPSCEQLQITAIWDATKEQNLTNSNDVIYIDHSASIRWIDHGARVLTEKLLSVRLRVMKKKYQQLTPGERLRQAVILFDSTRGRWLLAEALNLATSRLRKESDIAHRRISDIEDMELLHEFFLTPTTRHRKLGTEPEIVSH